MLFRIPSLIAIILAIFCTGTKELRSILDEPDFFSKRIDEGPFGQGPGGNEEVTRVASSIGQSN